MIELAVDIGGTFTDVCSIVTSDVETRVQWIKEPSTPANPIEAVVRGTRRILELLSASPSDVQRFLHGTTVATNAVLEKKGARIGLLMTQGFEDTLEMGRQYRSDMYLLDPEPETPAFLAPGRQRRGIPERISASGVVVVPLDEAATVQAVADLVDGVGVEAIAVCYLFAFINPAHELRTRELIRERYPHMDVSLSHEVDPLFREYERTCVTAFDAYLRPVVSNYLRALGDALRNQGVWAQVLTMQSRGGLASTAMAVERPITTLLSGPAAGVVAARWIAEQAGIQNCITLDMGGTSTDIALISFGRVVTTTSGQIGRYPLRTPMVEVSTIGAGGGSIAWLDRAGGLRVGPLSAAASPGPACYGRGGIEPTVTDACVVLGYLDPACFAGGIEIDPDASYTAVKRIANPLGMSVTEAALGIYRIVSSKMADQTRLSALKRGQDPRECTLVLFGGGGPVMGCPVAQELSIQEMLVPFAPGAFSAFGLLVSDVEYDDAVTFKAPADEADATLIEALFAKMEQRGLKRMLGDRVPKEDVVSQRTVDMRYEGQSYELEVQLPSPITAEALAQAQVGFRQAHARLYGHGSATAALEFVHLRTVQRSRGRKLHALEYLVPARPVGLHPTRRCHFAGVGSAVETPILWRHSMEPGQVVSGPAVIHQADTTTVVHPGFECRLADGGHLLLSWREK